jgi:YegS/Rv2252/BmrU family lipid kinase
MVLVANAAAGQGESDALDAACAILAEAVDLERRQTQRPEDLDEVARQLDGRTVVVAGGDGSVHAVVNALHRAEQLDRSVVGLIPLGTGNDLARAVGIPLDAERAARALLSSAPQPQDLLVGPDSVVAVNAVHVGVGAEAVLAGAALKGWLGPAAYPVGAVVAGTRCPGWRLEVRVDDEVVPIRGRTLMVGMSIGSSIGGGAPLAPDAEVDDGAVDVTAVATTGPVSRVRFAARLRTGRHGELDGVTFLRGRVISIEGDPVRANVDGEVSDPRPRWGWTARPRSWRLIRPDA